MKISQLQLLITGTTLLKVEVLSVLEMRPPSFRDMRLGDIFISLLVSDTFNPKTKRKLNQRLWINLMK
jgi:hypothetical protein